MGGGGRLLEKTLVNTQQSRCDIGIESQVLTQVSKNFKRYPAQAVRFFPQFPLV